MTMGSTLQSQDGHHPGHGFQPSRPDRLDARCWSGWAGTRATNRDPGMRHGQWTRIDEVLTQQMIRSGLEGVAGSHHEALCALTNVWLRILSELQRNPIPVPVRSGPDTPRNRTVPFLGRSLPGDRLAGTPPLTAYGDHVT
ncbi:hypothetical protein [Sulfobacillus thermosulfidooxidans]|uniref:hypothetical protein n=1 Tax=Sulfobacillus thermosulfidooxidans TaxID=28034 RepID=UPI00037832CF|nr:hypothetical protein [Sulfobacillus thermosulfidooxidans]